MRKKRAVLFANGRKMVVRGIRLDPISSVCVSGEGSRLPEEEQEGVEASKQLK